MDFTKFNRFESVQWTKKTEGFSFRKLKDLADDGISQFQIFGVFITSSNEYGKQPVAIGNDFLVNLPTHQLETVEEILKNQEAVKAIDNGECSLKIRTYNSKKFKKECFDVLFVNTNMQQADIF